MECAPFSRLTKAGRAIVTIPADQDAQPKPTLNGARDASTTDPATSRSDYTPAIGDVVESVGMLSLGDVIECEKYYNERKPVKGIIVSFENNKSVYVTSSGMWTSKPNDEDMTGIKFIGKCETTVFKDYSAARDFAKAYFANNSK